MLRCDKYKNVRDMVRERQQADIGDEILPTDHNFRVGKKILSKSLTGSPRWYSSKYHDAMAVVSELGAPSNFITMTCNPNWREIVENIHPGQFLPVHLSTCPFNCPLT